MIEKILLWFSIFAIGCIFGWVCCSVLVIGKIADLKMYYLSIIQDLKKELKHESYK